MDKWLGSDLHWKSKLNIANILWLIPISYWNCLQNDAKLVSVALIICCGVKVIWSKCFTLVKKSKNHPYLCNHMHGPLQWGVDQKVAFLIQNWLCWNVKIRICPHVNVNHFPWSRHRLTLCQISVMSNALFFSQNQPFNWILLK